MDSLLSRQQKYAICSMKVKAEIAFSSGMMERISCFSSLDIREWTLVSHQSASSKAAVAIPRRNC